MYDLFWVAVGWLERCGFHVMALVSHTNDMAYALFYAMEVEVRSHLTPSKAGRMTDGTTELLTTAVLESDDVFFHWSMFGTDMDTGVGMELLKIIVKLYEDFLLLILM